jgi:hypothetical protein
MFNLKKDQKFNITYFAKKYGKYITRSGQWNELCKEGYSLANNKVFVYFDLDANDYRTAVGDITLNVKGK